MTLDELLQKMEPQARRDKALITRCIDGLGLYAARLAEDDRSSPQIPEARELVETLVGYWGLDYGENARSADDFLRVFDERVNHAANGVVTEDGTFQAGDSVILGLHRFGMEMVTAQGDSAIGDMMAVSAKMKEIGADLDFERETLGELTAELEAAAWGLLHGQRISGRIEQGYDIRRAVVFDDAQGFALASHFDGQGFTTAESPDKPQPFAVWQFLLNGDKPDYYWLHFIGTEAEAMKAYQSYAASHATARGTEPVTMSEAWVSGKTEIPSNIEAYIADHSAGEHPGEWLALPTDASTLCGLFERIGVGGPAGNDYHIADLRLPFECMSRYVTTHDSLDELNMLAAFIKETPDFHLVELQAILTSGVMDVGEGIGALINLLYEDNLYAFNHIYADTPKDVARYYDRENDEIPEGVSFEEYGKQVVKEEGGAFTPWGYISCRYRELFPLYSGMVPEEYSVVEGALAELASKAAERPEGKPSVVDQIRAARSAPRSAEEQPPRHKSKGGPDL